MNKKIKKLLIDYINDLLFYSKIDKSFDSVICKKIKEIKSVLGEWYYEKD